MAITSPSPITTHVAFTSESTFSLFSRIQPGRARRVSDIWRDTRARVNGPASAQNNGKVHAGRRRGQTLTLYSGNLIIWKIISIKMSGREKRCLDFSSEWALLNCKGKRWQRTRIRAGWQNVSKWGWSTNSEGRPAECTLDWWINRWESNTARGKQ